MYWSSLTFASLEVRLRVNSMYVLAWRLTCSRMSCFYVLLHIIANLSGPSQGLTEWLLTESWTFCLFDRKVHISVRNVPVLVSKSRESISYHYACINIGCNGHGRFVLLIFRLGFTKARWRTALINTDVCPETRAIRLRGTMPLKHIVCVKVYTENNTNQAWDDL